ncbi:hypothetical protein ACFU76_07930 [Streptomyces sp. NPDC057539]|uniref:hypothetical protein n=1 Tax=Streptomyces sp. NPDC057539 TaxID=3346159 RepID=UPI00369C89CA
MAHDLPAFWQSLSQDAELKGRLAPPPNPDLRWIPAAGLLGAGVLLLLTGAVLLGVLALLAGGGAGFLAHRRYEEAAAALEAWKQSLYCRHCDRKFSKAAAYKTA